VAKQWWIGLVLVAAIIISGYAGVRYWPQPAEGLEASGTIEATQVELRAKVAGTVQSLALESGAPVLSGHLAAVVVRNDLTAQRERDALSVIKAEAQLADLQSGARAQEIHAAEIAVQTAEVTVSQAEKDMRRGEELLRQQILPAAEYERLQIGYELAGKNLAAAQTQLSLLEAGSRPEAVAAARAELERNRAVLKASEALLADTRIECPLAGTVINRAVEAGEFVQAGASIGTVADLNDMWIKVYLPTDDLPRVQLGQTVAISVSGIDQEFAGIVEEIASKGEFTPKTIQTKKERTNIMYAIKIRIAPGQEALKPGMPADVRFAG